MTQADNIALIAKWQNEPAPLLPILHAFHERDEYLSEESLKDISEILKIPIADLFGTVTFYHHFSLEEGGFKKLRVCTGPVCCLNGGKEILADTAKNGSSEMPCSGRCDQFIPVLKGNQTLIGKTANTLTPMPSLLPVKNPEDLEECLFESIREPRRNTIEGYYKTGGFEGLKSCFNMTPKKVIALLTESKLTGRGGAGFPTGIKWNAVAEASGDSKAIICNADEGEPGCFKDRVLMDYDPFAMIEGMLIAGYATGAEFGIIYLRYEYPETYTLLEKCIEDAKKNGWLGNNIQEKFNFTLYLRRGAGAYICGEETSLLNSLEGKHPFPRNKPPYPVTNGFNDKPTVINNVETLAAVPKIMVKGAQWYQDLGLGEQIGTKLISLSGDIQRPGNYEIPLGLPLKTLLYNWAGGPKKGHTIQAVTMAGLSGGFLAGEDMNVTLDEPSIRSKGSFLGAGGIIVYDDSRNMIEAAHSAMEFFAHESCGKCFPCRIGTQRISERLAGIGPKNAEQWQKEVEDIGEVMATSSACGLGIAAPLVSKSLIKYFPEKIKTFLE